MLFRIHPNNYEGLALKHYTSKLNAFSDLCTVRSFGFRGEALNALCEISQNITVTTKQSNEEVGATLKYDGNGRLILDLFYFDY